MPPTRIYMPEGPPCMLKCNESRPKGVRFVNSPPDLRKKPLIEPFETPAPGSKKNDPAKQCQSV
jgi:hypothetical protein